MNTKKLAFCFRSSSLEMVLHKASSFSYILIASLSKSLSWKDLFRPFSFGGLGDIVEVLVKEDLIISGEKARMSPWLFFPEMDFPNNKLKKLHLQNYLNQLFCLPQKNTLPTVLGLDSASYHCPFWIWQNSLA